ncbi:TetR/AcrR family transcriptional regulator [Virgisporangium ochraceum]|uniref:TetR family transcriptional regulator n=1 Tax=Virgisporangium ochraceum TaxID=65505 RepID=A0A8J4EDL0_9ACTN|nr:TetR/AcrR family transcriptional regulator [Virgisporangium ochraceum]GIJ70811.1 TetR family transcriptional regulator [Virgisporangium ochraceum]
MGVPRDGNPTRERIMRTAERLMTEQGYSATSVDQVIAGAGSSKGAFFHHFASKTDLAAHVVDRYVAADLAHLDAGLAATADIADPAARLVAFLRFYEDGADGLMAEQSGCLYATVLAEREFTGSEVNRRVAAAARVWRDALVDLLRPALAGRRSAAGIDLDALADHLYTTFEGGFILCRTLESPAAMRAQLRIYRQLVEALLRD